MCIRGKFVRGSWTALAAAVAALAVSAPAQATFYSFASDTNSSGYTVSGSAGAGSSFQISSPLVNSYTLLVDDDNGPLPSAAINNVGLIIDFQAQHASSQVFIASLWRHTYTVTGTARFVDSGGNTLLTIQFDSGTSGIFTVFGGQNSWSSVGSILGSDGIAAVRYSWTPALVAALGGPAAAAQYGIVGTDSIAPDDFSFDLSVLNAGAIGSPVQLDPTSKLPTSRWQSESSFSGSSNVPEPGSAAIAGLAIIAGMRRRRR